MIFYSEGLIIFYWIFFVWDMQFQQLKSYLIKQDKEFNQSKFCMQHPKKIVRTARLVKHSQHLQLSSQPIRKIERRASSSSSVEKQKLADNNLKSQSSLQLSKSSEESPNSKKITKLMKKQTIELVLEDYDLKQHHSLKQPRQMQLSSPLRYKLIELQRQDVNFLRNSQNSLKESLESQLNRMQRIRTSNNQVQENYYDTELLVRSLYNHQNLILHLQQIQLSLNDKSKFTELLLKDKLKPMEIDQYIESRKTYLESQYYAQNRVITQKELPQHLEVILNFAIRALSNSQYSEAKSQISSFIQTAKRQNSYELYCKILTETSTLVSDLQQLKSTLKAYENQSIQINKNIELSNKYLRQKKWNELEKLRIRLDENKSAKTNLNIGLFLESVIQNNKLKLKQSYSKQRQKVQSSPDKSSNAQIQSLKKQISNLKKQVQNGHRKSLLSGKQTSKYASLPCLLTKIQKERLQQTFEQPQKDVQQIVKLQQQRHTLEYKTRSLQRSKKTQQEKLSMFQKKNTSLQLSLKSRQQQLAFTQQSLAQTQKQLNQALQRIQKQETKHILDQRRHPQNTQNYQKVSIYELRRLQHDMEQLLKEKEEQSYNFLKIIQEKQHIINEYEAKFQGFDISSGSNKQLLKIELEDKQKELIKLKKLLIQSIETNKDSKDEKSPIQSLIDQILQIRSKKQQQALSQGFNFEFNNVQRQEWREVSKKIKQYKKKYPKNMFFTYLDEKHKYEFDLTQKLTDLQEKMLTIHNQVYKIKSIVSGSLKKKKLSVQEEQNWWKNSERIHVKENTQFAKLFNDMMDQICKFFIEGNPDITKSLTSEKDEKGENIYLEEIVTLQEEIGKMDVFLKQINDEITDTEKSFLQIISDCQNLRKSFQMSDFPQKISVLGQTIINLTKSFCNLLNSRQFLHIKSLSQESNANKDLQNQLWNKERDISELRLALTEIEKVKEILQRSKDEELESKQELKVKVMILEQTLRQYTCFKKDVEQQQNIVERIINQCSTEINYRQNQTHSQQDSSQSKDLVEELSIKYPQNGKVINFLLRIKLQLNEERKVSQNYAETLQSVLNVVNNLVLSLDIENEDNISNKIASLSKKLIQLKGYTQIVHKTSLNNQFCQKETRQIQSSYNNSKQLIRTTLSDQLQILSDRLQSILEKYTQSFQQDTELINKVSQLQLSQGGIVSERIELIEMQRIFNQIMKNKIIDSKLHSLLNQTEKQASIDRNPEIVRQIYFDQIKKKSQHNIQEHLNPIIESILTLFSRVNQIHIQYKNSIISKFQDQRINFIEQNKSLKATTQELRQLLREQKQRQRLTMIRSGNVLFSPIKTGKIQTSEQLKELCDEIQGLKKDKKQLQVQVKKISLTAKQLENESVFIDKILNLTLEYSSDSKVVINAEEQQRKQINAFRKQYPQSKIIVFIQAVYKKMSSISNKLSIIETQNQSIIQFYADLTQRMQTNPSHWFHNYQPKINTHSDFSKILKELVRKIVQNSKQLQALSKSKIQLQSSIKTLQSDSVKHKEIVQSISQLQKCLQKSIKESLSCTTREKGEDFFSGFNLKKIFEKQVAKVSKLKNLQSLIQTISTVFHEVWLELVACQKKKIEDMDLLRNRHDKDNQQLKERMIEVNLRNKQLEVTNKQLSSENRIIKQAYNKLENSVSYFQDGQKSSQSSEKHKEYEILRLRQTIQTYLNQETKLEIAINQLEKQKKEQQRQIEKLKKQIQQQKQEIQDNDEEKNQINRLLDSLKLKSIHNEVSLQQNQQIVTNLRANYSKIQNQFQSIENKVSTLLEEKSLLQDQLNQLKLNSKQEKQQLQKDLSNKKLALQQTEQTNFKLQKLNQQLQLKLNHLQITNQIELSHQNSLIQRLQTQIKDIIQRQLREREELTTKIEKLTNEKNLIVDNKQEQIQKYRQKLLELDLKQQRQKFLQVQTFTKDIGQLNQNYTQHVKNYEKQKLQDRQNYRKTINDYENTIKRWSQQKIELIQKYENLLSDQKSSRFHEIKCIHQELKRLQLQNQSLRDTLSFTQKELSNANKERQASSFKLTEVQSHLNEVSFKLQLCETRLTESEKACIRLASFERKTKEYEDILFLNNISVSEGKQITKKSIFNNNLQTRLKQAELIKEQNYKLQSKVEKLLVQLDKEVSQKQFLRQQSQLNREDYIKFVAQSKQDLRHLREQNQILSYEKNLSENQVFHYKESIRQIHHKNIQLQEEIRNLKVQLDKQKLSMKNSLQKDLNNQIESSQKLISQKNNKLREYQADLSKLKQKLNQIDTSNRIKDTQMMELRAKLKQTEIKAKNDKEKSQIISSSQKKQFFTEIQLLKENLNKTRNQLEKNFKELALFKASLDQKSRQSQALKCELQSLQKISTIQKVNLQKKVRQTQHKIQGFEQKFRQSGYFEYQNKVAIQNRQSSEIKDLKNQLGLNEKELNLAYNKIKLLQNGNQQRQKQMNGMIRYLQELQLKLDEKMSQNSGLLKSKMEMQMKLKEAQIKIRFQNLEMKAQFDFQKRSNEGLEQRCFNLEKEIASGKNPVSPSSIIKDEFKENALQKIHELESENLSLKRQLDSVKQINQQMECSNSQMRAKNSQLVTIAHEFNQLRMSHFSLQQKLGSNRHEMEVLISKNKQLQHSKTLLQCEFNELHVDCAKLSETLRVQTEKYRNSMRVLDHELIEYKSKIQNVQECLREEKEKNYKYRQEIETFKNSHIQAQLTSTNGNSSFQAELEKLKVKNHQLQKKIIAKDFELQQLHLNSRNWASQIHHLQSQIDYLREENERLLLTQKTNMQFVTSESKKLQGLLSYVENQHSSNPISQLQSQAQFDLLIQVSSKIYQLIQQNQSLQSKCHFLQQQNNLWALSSDGQSKNDHVLAFHLQEMLEKIVEFAMAHHLIDNSRLDSTIFMNIHSQKISQNFDKVEIILKDLLLKVSQQSQQAQRNGWSLERTKKLLKLYIKEGDKGAFESLKQIAFS